ncbi:MAG: hypothetical protein WAM39_19845 [Bryobacteraceae bacterium]
MTSITRYALTFALAAGAALLPLRATAQTTEVKGEFDLPVKTHLAQLTLPPGHYTLQIQHLIDGQQVLRLKGPEGSQIKLLGAYSFVNKANVNYLRLEKVGGSYAVKEFHCGAIGQVYSFRALNPNEIEADNTPNGPQHVMVAVNSHK